MIPKQLVALKNSNKDRFRFFAYCINPIVKQKECVNNEVSKQFKKHFEILSITEDNAVEGKKTGTNRTRPVGS